MALGNGSVPNTRLLMGNLNSGMLTGTGGRGPVEISSLYQSLMKNGLFPRRVEHDPATMDAQLRNYQYDDMRIDYNDRFQPLPTEQVSAALFNTRHLNLVTRVAPLYPTNELHFSIINSEVQQFPFDRVGEGGVARYTGYSVRERKATTNRYKRMIKLSFDKIADENFGAAYYTQARDSLVTQATMTMTLAIVCALVDVPYQRKVARYSQLSRPFSHTREILKRDNHGMFLAHVEPDEFVQTLMQHCTPDNGIDTVVMPSKAIVLLQNISKERRPMPAYLPVKNDSGVMEYLQYEGELSEASIPMGNGRYLHFMGCDEHRITHEDGEEDVLQPLRLGTVSGEMFVMPDLSGLSDRLPIKPTALDMGVPNHEALSLRIERITFKKAIENCIIWFNKDGTLAETDPNVANDTDLGDHYIELIAHYNDVNVRPQVLAAFSGANITRDHNEPPPNQAQQAMRDVTAFRHFFPFVRLAFDAGAGTTGIVKPEYVMDLVPHAISKDTIELAVAQIHAMLEGKTQAQQRDLLKRLFPMHPVAILDRFFTDADTRAVAKHTVDFAAEQRLIAALQAADIALAANPGDAALQAAARRASAAAAGITIPPAPRAGEGTLARDSFAGGLSTEWRQLFSFTTAASEPTARRMYDLATSEGRHDDAAALINDMLPALKSRAHADEVFKGVARRLDTEASFAKIAPANNGPWIRTSTEAQLSERTAADVPPGPIASELLADETEARSTTEGRDVSAGRGPYLRENGVDANIVFIRDRVATNAALADLYDDTVIAPAGNRPQDWSRYNVLLFCIMSTPFSRKALAALAQYGVVLMRVNLVRPRITQLCDATALVAADGNTMISALGHVSVLSNLDGDHEELHLNVAFNHGVICLADHRVDCIENAVAYQYRGGRTTGFIKSNAELGHASVHRNSMLALPVPNTETKYHFPVSPNRDPAYGAIDTDGPTLLQKVSFTDLLAAYLGDPTNGLDAVMTYQDGGPQYDVPMFAPMWHRGCTWYEDIHSGMMHPVPGTGPYGEIGRNVSGAARVYNGMGRWPTNYEKEMVLTI